MPMTYYTIIEAAKMYFWDIKRYLAYVLREIIIQVFTMLILSAGKEIDYLRIIQLSLLVKCRGPVLEYFKQFFGEIVKGRRGYENLLPLTIGVGSNKCKKMGAN